MSNRKRSLMKQNTVEKIYLDQMKRKDELEKKRNRFKKCKYLCCFC